MKQMVLSALTLRLKLDRQQIPLFLMRSEEGIEKHTSLYHLDTNHFTPTFEDAASHQREIVEVYSPRERTELTDLLPTM